MPLSYTIGVLSRHSNVTVETIRYYERTGLLPKPQRSSGGYRQYGDSDLRRLRFIRRGRDLGFATQEIKTLIGLAEDPEYSCADADQLVLQHLEAVNARIRDLETLRDTFTHLMKCKATKTRHCRLIEALDQRQCCQ